MKIAPPHRSANPDQTHVIVPITSHAEDTVPHASEGGSPEEEPQAADTTTKGTKNDTSDNPSDNPSHNRDTPPETHQERKEQPATGASRLTLSDATWNDITVNSDDEATGVFGFTFKEFKSKQLRTLCSRLNSRD